MNTNTPNSTSSKFNTVMPDANYAEKPSGQIIENKEVEIGATDDINRRSPLIACMENAGQRSEILKHLGAREITSLRKTCLSLRELLKDVLPLSILAMEGMKHIDFTLTFQKLYPANGMIPVNVVVTTLNTTLLQEVINTKSISVRSCECKGGILDLQNLLDTLPNEILSLSIERKTSIRLERFTQLQSLKLQCIDNRMVIPTALTNLEINESITYPAKLDLSKLPKLRSMKLKHLHEDSLTSISTTLTRLDVESISKRTTLSTSKIDLGKNLANLQSLKVKSIWADVTGPTELINIQVDKFCFAGKLNLSQCTRLQSATIKGSRGNREKVIYPQHYS